jgi:hypothetical protein
MNSNRNIVLEILPPLLSRDDTGHVASGYLSRHPTVTRTRTSCRQVKVQGKPLKRINDVELC